VLGEGMSLLSKGVFFLSVVEGGI